MVLFTLSKVFCPFALICFLQSNPNQCPNNCECYQSVNETTSAVCGSLNKNDFNSQKLYTLALVNISFDDQILIDNNLLKITFRHLVIEGCGGAPTIGKNNSRKQSGSLGMPQTDHETLTITNSRNIYDWKWTNYGFKHVLIDSCRLYAFKKAELSRQFVDDVIGRQVESLTIIKSHLAVVKHEALKNMVRLKYLNLSYNRINELLPESFDKHTRIWYLNLKGNLINYIDDQLFDRMPRLRELDLSSNHISFIEYSQFRPIWDTLKYLDIRGNKFPCNILCWIFHLKGPHPFPVDDTDCYIGQSWSIIRNARHRIPYCLP